jgi:hypothetical protein
MAQYEVAHIRVQGVDLVIVPLKSEYGRKSASEQDSIRRSLQAYSRAAGLRGTVVPVWESPSGGMRFLAPRSYHPFFQSINLSYVAMNINKVLRCG